MNYGEIKRIFQELKRTSPREDLTAYIIFTEDSFVKKYPLLSRTYCGEWVELSIDRVYGYCALLERYLNRKEG